MTDRKDFLVYIARIAQSYGWTPIGLSGKTPRFRNWQTMKIDPLDPNKRIRHIEHLYDARLADNIGILTGKNSGIVVLDVDKGSMDWFSQLVSLNGPLPETFTVQTGDNGLHIYFQYTSELENIGNMNKILGQNIDYRTDRGVIIFPGSIHPLTQKMYLVKSGYINGQPIIAKMPSYILELLQQNKR